MIINQRFKQESQRDPIEHQSDTVEPFPYQKLMLLVAAVLCFVGDQTAWVWSLTQTSLANSTLCQICHQQLAQPHHVPLTQNLF
ncbi:MAG: hypothetical protein AB4290_05820 [Spirulina sp.]